LRQQAAVHLRQDSLVLRFIIRLVGSGKTTLLEKSLPMLPAGALVLPSAALVLASAALVLPCPVHPEG
jgi:hypothetical protein